MKEHFFKNVTCNSKNQDLVKNSGFLSKLGIKIGLSKLRFTCFVLKKYKKCFNNCNDNLKSMRYLTS